DHLKQKRRDAREQAAVQTEEYMDFCQTQSAHVEDRRRHVKEWEDTSESERLKMTNPCW
ncbi:hypothetical protein V5O48_019117, partial [Marasmius crinis-equi]